MRSLDALFDAMVEQGDKVVGLVVMHRDRAITLTKYPGQWQAVTLAEPADIEDHDVLGFGATVAEALDACANEADLVEQSDEDEIGGDDV